MANHFRKKDSARIVWDTKPKRAPNPKDIEFQTAEVVIPNPEKAGQLPLSFRDKLIGEDELDKQKMNRLIWGDNLLAMQALLAQGYEGKINLIYIDPPFDSKADYSHKIKIDGTEMTKEPSVIERLAYKDTWAGGTDSYLDMLYPRLQLMKRLLAPDGSIYVHLDWHIGHYVKVMMDEIFGKDNFINEIVWAYTGPRKAGRYFTRKHDVVFLYSKSDNYVFNPQYIPHKSGLHNVGQVFGSEEEDEEGVKELEEKGKQAEDWWIDIWATERYRSELLGYDTQKPSPLLERIIKASSSENDLVADFFCGSGTALAVAEKLNRRWLGTELGKVGIQVTRGRLVEQEANPFLIENIGNYQREMIYLSGGRIYEMQKIILKLYGATPIKNRHDLGVRKDEKTLELVYCGYPDRPVAARKVEELAAEARDLEGTGYKRLVILAWDYEYNYDELLASRLRAAGKDIKTEVVSRQIPQDIYEYLKKARDEEEIETLAAKVHFSEKPYLKLAEPKIDGTTATIGIDNYVLYDFPLGSGKKADEARIELLKMVKDNFAVLIDYWAVDWNYDGFTFKSAWQDLRGSGRKAKTVSAKTAHTYESPGKYTIAIRVVDIFGNDATGTLEATV
ncbi:MAG: DNA methyltransferase [Patescibacteria group bacterium]